MSEIEVIPDHSGPPVFAPESATREAVTQWLQSGAYLPPVMRDFHDQKRLFSAIHEVKERSVAKNGGAYMRDLSWIDAHVYTVDIFLWMMARHGYTLQRSRKPMAYDDLDDFVSDAKRRHDAMAAKVLGLTPIQTAPTPDDGDVKSSAKAGSGMNNQAQEPVQ